MERGLFGWIAVALLLIWECVFVPKLLGDMTTFSSEIRSALYPVAEIATTVAKTVGIALTALIWALGTVGLLFTVYLSRGRKAQATIAPSYP